MKHKKILQFFFYFFGAQGVNGERMIFFSFPRMEVTIDALDYHEKLMMKPLYLDNLFEENFDNLQDYVRKFIFDEAYRKISGVKILITRGRIYGQGGN